MKWLCLFLSIPFFLSGIYLGNPLSPQLPKDGIKSSKEERLQVRLGYIGEFIHLSEDDLSTNMQLGSVGCSFYHTILLEAIVGSSSIQSTMKQANVLEQLYTADVFCYGIRMQGVLKKWRKFVLGISASGLLGHAKHLDETVQGQAIDPPSKHLRWKTWQGGIAVARKNEVFTPYLGFGLSNFIAKSQSIDRRMKHHVIGIIGGSIAAFAAVVATVEARFFSEQSITMACYVAF